MVFFNEILFYKKKKKKKSFINLSNTLQHVTFLIKIIQISRCHHDIFFMELEFLKLEFHVKLVFHKLEF